MIKIPHRRAHSKNEKYDDQGLLFNNEDSVDG